MTGSDFGDFFYGGAGVDTIDQLYGGGTLADGLDTLELSFVKSVGAVVNLETGLWRMGRAPFQTILGIEAVSGTQRNDVMAGTAGQETLVGQGGNDGLFGRDDVDNLSGVGGDDTVLGEGGRDIIFGGSGADRLEGDDGNDVLQGGTGLDSLLGGAEDDAQSGDGGNDQLVGGTGRDTLNGGQGNDLPTCGVGADDFQFYTAPPSLQDLDRITDFQSGTDRIVLPGANASTVFAGLGPTLEAGETVNGTRAPCFMIPTATAGWARWRSLFCCQGRPVWVWAISFCSDGKGQ